ncbi:M50 family metallopeptidase [Arthrobacter sp. GCM10027362]|uniref:M50 family metallopeptidase n=1 Tax=Arthrobacter sp. GCM10027362 TaxID=3273379 RepID=UPI003633EFBB
MNAAAGAAQDIAAQWWDKVLAGFGRGAPVEPSALVLAAIIAAAVAVSVPRAGWRWFGLFVTVVHELGHAFAALMTGQAVKGIHLRFDHSGAMHSLSRRNGRAGAAWSGFWGYPAPAVVGAALVWAAYAGWSGLALSASALLFLATLLFIRNWQGVVIALGCAAAAVLLLWYATPVFLGYFTLAIGVALLVGAVRDWFKVLGVHTRRRHELASSDAYILSRGTGVPAAVWLGGFAAVIAASCLAGLGAVAGSLG